MGILKNKVVRLAAGFPLTLGLSVGVGLPMAVTDVAGVVRTAPAAAAPSAPAPLKDALLELDDLPKGYTVLDFDPAETIAGMLEPGDMSADPCAVADGIDTDELTPDTPVAPPWRPDRPGRPPKHDKPTKGDKPESPVKIDWPDLSDWPSMSDKPVKATVAAAEPELEAVSFLKGTEGPVLMETLYDAGRKQARALVRQAADVLKRCPDVENDDVRIESKPLVKMPELGDESVAMSMVVTLKEEGYELSVLGKLVAVAYGDVYVTVALVGVPAPSTGELKKIAKKAIRKLGNA